MALFAAACCLVMGAEGGRFPAGCSAQAPLVNCLAGRCAGLDSLASLKTGGEVQTFRPCSELISCAE